MQYHPMINLCNILTLRYDPTSKIKQEIPSIKYYNSRQRMNDSPSATEPENAIRYNIKKSIAHIEPKRITVGLSSGIDSNLILRLIRDEFSDLEVHSINVIFDDESNESRVAKKMAESIGSDFHELRVDDPIKHLPKILSIVGEPRWNVYQYYLIEEAKKFSQILFTGDGGDELFGGYTFRYKKFLDRYNESFTWDDKVRIYLECHDRDWVPDQETLFGEKLNFRWENIYELFRKFFDNNMAPLDQVFLADYYGKLMHDFIPTSKKLCDFFGVEGASPLLGNNVIEISRQIPSEEKYDRVAQHW